MSNQRLRRRRSTGRRRGQLACRNLLSFTDLGLSGPPNVAGLTGLPTYANEMDLNMELNNVTTVFNERYMSM